MRDWVVDSFRARIRLQEKLIEDKELSKNFLQAYRILAETIRSGGKILIFGNGGSAAESQHFAAELVCQFMRSRRPFSAIALTADTSVLTAQSNDFGFEHVFSRQIEAHYRKEDAVVGFTTSDINLENGHSLNIHNAFKVALDLGAKRIGLFSVKTKLLSNMVDVALRVPETRVDLIQEAHLELMHMLCDRLEQELSD